MRWVLLIGVLLVLTTSVSALEIDKYNAVYNLVDDKAVVEIEIVFSEEFTGEFNLSLPEDYTALTVYLDDLQAEFTGELENVTFLRYNYVTQDVIDKTNFLMNMQVDQNIKYLEIKLVLPAGALLKKPLHKQGGSIYPKPTERDTDGRSLIFIWEDEDLRPGDEIAMFAQIEPKKDYSGWIALIVILLILFPVIYFAYPRKVKQAKQERKPEKHLKEDEEQIVTILERKEGECEQGTLRVITGFSKAHLSRLLKELEERKVIHKEKRGKKNIVFLK